MIINYPTFLYKPISTSEYISLKISSNVPIQELDEAVPFMNIDIPIVEESTSPTDELIEIHVSNTPNLDISEFFNVDDITFSNEVDTIPCGILININNKTNFYDQQYLSNNKTTLLNNLEQNIDLYRDKCNQYKTLNSQLVNTNRKLTHITVVNQISDVIDEDVSQEIKSLQSQKDTIQQNMATIRTEIFLAIANIKKLKNAL